MDNGLKKAFIERAKTDGTTATELIVGFMQQYLGIEGSPSSVAVVDSEAIQTQISELEQRLSERIAALEEALPGKSQAMA